MDEINAEIFAGRKIGAIKLYREATGEGLKESKDFIEALSIRLHEESSEKFQVEPGKGGCAGVLLFVAVILGGASCWFCAM